MKMRLHAICPKFSEMPLCLEENPTLSATRTVMYCPIPKRHAKRRYGGYLRYIDRL